jgi:hypothetical protein
LGVDYVVGADAGQTGTVQLTADSKVSVQASVDYLCGRRTHIIGGVSYEDREADFNIGSAPLSSDTSTISIFGGVKFDL